MLIKEEKKNYYFIWRYYNQVRIVFSLNNTIPFFIFFFTSFQQLSTAL